MNKNLLPLKIALVLIGLFFIFGLVSMTILFPESWLWKPAQPEYEQMILGIYATLGVFLLWAAKNPIEHISLLWFTVWSSFVHATIMFVQALQDKTELANLHGDIPGLYLVAIVLALLIPRRKKI